jgi:hypothetical protein
MKSAAIFHNPCSSAQQFVARAAPRKLGYPAPRLQA